MAPCSWWRRWTHLFARRPGRAPDRRQWERFRCEAQVRCKVAVDEVGAASVGHCVNVSLGGAALALSQPYEPGTLVTVCLRPAGGPDYTRLALVRHRHQATSNWHIGVKFHSELCDPDLEGLHIGERMGRERFR